MRQGDKVNYLKWRTDGLKVLGVYVATEESQKKLRTDGRREFVLDCINGNSRYPSSPTGDEFLLLTTWWLLDYVLKPTNDLVVDVQRRLVDFF